MKPLGQVFMAGTTKVSHLLSANGRSWDMGRVRAMFSDDDATDIQQIAIRGPGTDNYQAWNHTKDGNFSVKSLTT